MYVLGRSLELEYSLRGMALATDGGVYDNMGTEAVWKRCRTILISNAGKPFGFDFEDLGVPSTRAVVGNVAVEVEPLAHRTRRREQRVGLGQVEIHGCGFRVCQRNSKDSVGTQL